MFTIAITYDLTFIDCFDVHLFWLLALNILLFTVKPYIPYDVVPSQYVLPMATSSTGDPLPLQELRVPAWVVDADIIMLPVMLPILVQEQLREALLHRTSKITSGSTSFFEDAVELITQVLRQDIRGVHQGRGKLVDQQENAPSKSSYNCTLDGLEIEFATTSTEIIVQSIRNVISLPCLTTHN